MIGIVGAEAKIEVARAAGADEVLVRDDDYPAHLRELTDGAGVDLVLNSVGGDTVARDLGATAEFGAVVVFGQSSGAPGRVPTDALHKGTRALLGYSSGHLRHRHPELLRATVERFLLRISDGTLSIRVGARYTLAEAGQAHALIERGTCTGKVVLTVSG